MRPTMATRQTQSLPFEIEYRLGSQRHLDATGPPMMTNSNSGDAEWMSRVTRWQHTGRWNKQYGPPPGEIGCQVPHHILVACHAPLANGHDIEVAQTPPTSPADAPHTLIELPDEQDRAAGTHRDGRRAQTKSDRAE